MNVCELSDCLSVVWVGARKDPRLHQYRRKGLGHLIVQLARQLLADLERVEMRDLGLVEGNAYSLRPRASTHARQFDDGPDGPHLMVNDLHALTVLPYARPALQHGAGSAGKCIRKSKFVHRTPGRFLTTTHA